MLTDPRTGAGRELALEPVSVDEADVHRQRPGTRRGRLPLERPLGERAGAQRKDAPAVEEDEAIEIDGSETAAGDVVVGDDLGEKRVLVRDGAESAVLSDHRDGDRVSRAGRIGAHDQAGWLR